MNARESAVDGPVESFSELPQFSTDSSSAALLPLEYCLEKRIVVLGKPADAAAVTIGMLTPGDRPLLDELAAKLGRRITPVQLNEFEVRRAISRVFDIPVSGDTGEVVVLESSREIVFEAGRPALEILDDLLAAAIDRARERGCAVLEGTALPGDRDTKNLYERAGITARLITVSTRLDS